MSSAKHVGVYWNPSPDAEDRAAAQEWVAKAATPIEFILASDPEQFLQACENNSANLSFVVVKAGTSKQASGIDLVKCVHTKVGKQVFSILYSNTLSMSASGRLVAADEGIHMTSHRHDQISEAIRKVTCYPAFTDRESASEAFPYNCPLCPMKSLDARALWEHMPLFHVNEKKLRNRAQCPICQQFDRTLVVHIHDEHAPPGHPADTSRSGLPLYSFGLVVVRRKRDGKFLVVQEYSNQGYWLPGGGIDAGEMPDKAALRECVEEVGVRVHLTGVLRVEVAPSPRMVRSRYIFYGEPDDEDDCEPKTIPDFESAGACWVTGDEIRSGKLRLRGGEPEEWFTYVENGGKIHDISLLALEGAPPPPIEQPAATAACC